MVTAASNIIPFSSFRKNEGRGSVFSAILTILCFGGAFGTEGPTSNDISESDLLVANMVVVRCGGVCTVSAGFGTTFGGSCFCCCSSSGGEVSCSSDATGVADSGGGVSSTDAAWNMLCCGGGDSFLTAEALNIPVFGDGASFLTADAWNMVGCGGGDSFWTSEALNIVACGGGVSFAGALVNMDDWGAGTFFVEAETSNICPLGPAAKVEGRTGAFSVIFKTFFLGDSNGLAS